MSWLVSEKSEGGASPLLCDPPMVEKESVANIFGVARAMQKKTHLPIIDTPVTELNQ